jgi:hypothetical protein
MVKKFDCMSQAKVRGVSELVTVGSRVEVQGDLRKDGVGEEYLQVVLITNLDSGRKMSLPAPICPDKRGMLSDGAPNTAASLEQHAVGTDFEENGADSRVARYLERLASYREVHLPQLNVTHI